MWRIYFVLAFVFVPIFVHSETVVIKHREHEVEQVESLSVLEPITVAEDEKDAQQSLMKRCPYPPQVFTQEFFLKTPTYKCSGCD